MPQDLIMSKQNILDFLPLISNEDMDAKTRKVNEVRTVARPGGRRDKDTHKPWMACLHLGGFLLSATGAA